MMENIWLNKEFSRTEKYECKLGEGELVQLYYLKQKHFLISLIIE